MYFKFHTNRKPTMKKKFSWKSFISFGLFFYFFVIFFSGIILYIAPPGRIANWTNWELIGLTKSQWQTMHTNFSYLFAILSIFHLFTANSAWKLIPGEYRISPAADGYNPGTESEGKVSVRFQQKAIFPWRNSDPA